MRQLIVRLVLRGFVATGCLVAGGIVLASPAWAHASVVSSVPIDGARLSVAPQQVSITFNEPVGLGGIGYLHVTDAAGTRVDAAAAFHPPGRSDVVVDRLRPGLPDGGYVISYRVISADTHPVAGSVSYVLGHGSLPATGTTTNATDMGTGAVLDAARGVSYTGLVLLGGIWLLLTAWTAGLRVRRARVTVLTGWSLLLVGAAAELALQGPYAAGSSVGRVLDAGLLNDTLHSTYGVLLLARVVLLIGLGVVLGVLRRGRRRALGTTAAVMVAGLIATFSLAGHPSTTSPDWLSEAADALHLTAMATWVGGLTLLAVALLPRRDTSELRAVLRVFSPAAFGSVVVLAVTGTYAAWRGIGAWSAIVGTTYGLLVLGKVALFLVLVALGYLSRRAVQQRWSVRDTVAYAMTDSAVQDTAPAIDKATLDVLRLRRTVLLEMLVAIGVLALTAVLVAQPRGPEALATDARRPVSANAPLTAASALTITADPGAAGPVQLTIMLPVGANARSVTATATQPQQQLGPLPVALSRVGPAEWRGTASLPAAGEWHIDLVVTSSAFDAVTTDAVLTIH